MVNKTTDIEAVSNILNHPMVYRMSSDDTTPETVEPIETDFYIMNSEKTGVVQLVPLNGKCCMAHIACLPTLRGGARSFTKEAMGWGFNNTPFSKVVGMIPAYNRLAINMCLDVGFTKEGLITRSFLKNFKYHDQVILGITKTEFYGGDISCQL